MDNNWITVVVLPALALIACGVWLAILAGKQGRADVNLKCFGLSLQLRLNEHKSCRADCPILARLEEKVG